MRGDLLPPPLTEAVRACLERTQALWRSRGGRVLVVPACGPARPGFPAKGSPCLILAERQDFRAEWPGGTATLGEDDALVIPAGRPYRVTFDVRRQRHPALYLFASDGDLVLIRRNLPVERWKEATWRFAGGLGAIFDEALALAARLDGQAWAQAEQRRLVGLALAAAGEAVTHPQRASRGGPAVAVRCREVLRRDLADPALDVPQVAAALGYHPRWLGRQYRRETGESLRETLLNLRVQRGRELLRRRDLSVAAIATACGFASLSHFSRSFRRIEGNPPRTFRRYGHLEADAGGEPGGSGRVV